MLSNIPVTTKHNIVEYRDFVYTEYNEAKLINELDYYNLNDICDYEMTSQISFDKCPKNILDKSLKFCKKAGEFLFIIYEKHGFIVFLKSAKKFPDKHYWRYNKWFWKKHKLIFDIRIIN